MPEIKLRKSQAKILDYTGGLMGISAVPGSGKTWTLSQLATKLILTAELAPDQEILVVTFSNSAANNFSARIGGLLRQSGLLAGMGYRVRTLHGLANDIIHERPELAGLGNEFSIIDESESNDILSNQVDTWFRLNPSFFDDFLDDSLSSKKLEAIKTKELLRLINEIARAFIGTAKDLRLTNEALNVLIDQNNGNSPLLRFGHSIYSGYQSALNYRGAIDFDDLIRLAYQCLIGDPNLVTQLHYRWPYILEDEAQDSSKLQEKILRLLVGPNGNWVRVGDPNQAIYESFTTADPNLLKRYMMQPQVRAENLPESGRSSQKIINLANSLNAYVQHEHPNPAVRDALSLPFIQATSPGDPQPNPPDRLDSVQLLNYRMSKDQELRFLVTEIEKWLQAEPDTTVVVLANYNARVIEIADALKKKKLPVVEALMNLPETTRLSAGTIANILTCISQPLNTHQLATAYRVWKRKEREDDQRWKQVLENANLIVNCQKPEDFLYPLGANDWLVALEREGIPQKELEDLFKYRQIVRKWQLAAVLPADQLILTIAQDLVLDPFELATVHKLALMVKELQEDHPDWSLAELINELSSIAKNARRFFNFSESEEGFDPEQHKGQVVVATTHKSKGLEWDKVFITSANNYDYPSGIGNEDYYSEKYYLKDRLNLQAETLAQLQALVKDRPQTAGMLGGETLDARNDFIRERLRLLYVGITRARRSLTVTWNAGKLNRSTEALAIERLREKMDQGEL